MAEWTTEDVRDRVTQSRFGETQRQVYSGKFSTWLSAHEAEAKAEALEEAATSLEGGLGVEGTPGTLYEYRAWLRARAAAIRGERCNGRDPGYEGTCPLPLNHPEGCFNDSWADA